MADSDPLAFTLQRPTPARPLLGMTILVVEDSRFASEALRLLCLRSGARIRRADSLRAARRHLQVYRPSAVVVDLGLPDGSGLDLIRELAAARPRPAAILASSGERAEAEALRAGADGFLEKPLHSLAAFQEAILAHLPPERQPPGPRELRDSPITPDPLAFRDDMALAAETLTDLDDVKTLDYAVQFLGGVARSASDDALARATAALARTRAEGGPITAQAAQLAGMVQDRLRRTPAV